MSITPDTNIVEQHPFCKVALNIYHAGFNVVPMDFESKTPIGTWKEYTEAYQTEKQVSTFDWENGKNIAIVNGVNDIRSIDLDDCDNIDVLYNILQLLGLTFDYPWIVVTPGGGFHIHFLCNEALTLTKNGVLVGDPIEENTFKQIELRWSNCLTMFPPSIHPDAKEPYLWIGGIPQTSMIELPLHLVETAFRSVATIQKKAKLKVLDQDANQDNRKIKYDAWAQKALDQEIGILRSSGEGSRNNQLNRSAFALGQIVGAGLLDEKDCIAELSRTATSIGLSENEIETTIKSGLEAGILKPRMPKQVYKDREPAPKLPAVKDISEEKIASYSADDQGHAEAVYALYGPYIAFNSAFGWMIWNGTHYVPSVQRINTLIVSVLRLRSRAASHLQRGDLAKVSKSMAGTVSATRGLLENLAVVKEDEFDVEPDLINCLSGIVSLKTKKLIPHDPSYRFTWCAPVNYNPNANGDLWLNFINETVESPNMAAYLQEALGYSITGHTSEESLFYIFGPPRSGKGTLSETILAIFPRPICIEVDFNSFTAKREGDNQNFDLAPMKAARMVFASESNKYQSLNPAKVKALTGGNLVSCAFKHKDFFTYRPQYSVWLSSNHECNADADDDALWGRVKVVHFPNSRLGREDKSLKWRMQTPENLEFVLAWLVEGAYQWYQHQERGLKTPQEVLEITNKQRNDQDSIGLWLEECCTLSADSWTENNKLRTAYENWCIANGYEPKKANGFARSLSAHGLEVGVQKRIYSASNENGEKVRGVRGLSVN